ncbi:MAG: ABC transporter substrate-binding protein [Candidatus Hodarchaeales archaeon]
MLKLPAQFLGIIIGSILIVATLPVPAQAEGEQLEFSMIHQMFIFKADILAQIVQADLQAIGVTADIGSYTGWELSRRMREGNFDTVVGALTGPSYADTDCILYLAHALEALELGFRGTLLYGVPPNPEIDAKLQQARTSFNTTERQRLYQDVQWLTHKETPYVPLVDAPFYTAFVKGLTGFKIYPMGFWLSSFANASKPGLDTIVIAQLEDVNSALDPAEISLAYDWSVHRQIYDGLYNPSPTSWEPIPALATNYSRSEDGTEWTFSLRQGVKFHDGTPFNASAVVFTFERMMNWDNMSSEYFKKEWAPKVGVWFDAFLTSVFASVQALDLYTVKFTLAYPVSFFLKMLAMPMCAIVSPTEHIPRYPRDVVVGTGPYEFKTYISESTTTLERFEGYWGAPAKTPRLRRRFMWWIRR